jgi:hypothetical protein
MAQTKKTSKKPTRKPAVKTVAVSAAAAPECACAKHCVCWKKVLIFVLGLIVGAGACCVLHCKKGHKIWGKKPANFEHKFVNGCLDVSKIDCPEMVDKVQLKDADKNGCITKEEFFGEPKGEAPRKFRRPRAPRAGQ